MAFRNISVVLTANVAGYVAGMSKAAAATKTFQGAATTAGAGAANFGKGSTAATTQIDGLSKGATAGVRSFDRLTGAFLLGKKAMAAAGTETSKFGGAMTGLASLAKNAIGTFAGFLAIHAIINTTRAVIMGAVNAFRDFDGAMTESLAIMSDVDRAQRQMMETAAMDAAKGTIFTPAEAAEGYYYLASAGMSAAASIASIRDVTEFAQAGVMDLARATEILMDAQNSLGMRTANTTENAENLRRVSDVVVAGAMASNATVEQFGEAISNRAGAAARLVGKDVEELTSVLAAFASVGVKGAEAGTRMDIVWRDLQRRAIGNTAAMERYGIAVFDTSGNMNHTADIIQDMEVAFASMSDEQKRSAILEMGFQDRSVAAILSLMGLSGAIRDYETDLDAAGGTTQRVAERQMESMNNQIKALTSRLQVMSVQVGKAVQKVTAWFASRLSPAIGETAKVIGTLVEMAVDVGKVFAAVIGLPIVRVFEALAVGVAEVMGWFAKNEQIVRALATLYMSKFLPSIMASVAATYSAVKAKVTLGVTTGILRQRLLMYDKAVAMSATSMTRLQFVASTTSGRFVVLKTRALMAWAALKAGNLAGLKESMASLGNEAQKTGMTLGGAFTAGLTALAVVVPMAMSAMSNSIAQGGEAVRELADDAFGEVDESNFTELMEQRNRAMETANTAITEYNNAVDEMGGLETALANTGQVLNPRMDNSIAEAMGRVEEWIEIFEELDEPTQNWIENLAPISAEFGLSLEDAGDKAFEMGVDLSASYESSEAARREFANGLEQQIRVEEYAAERSRGASDLVAQSWSTLYADQEANFENVKAGFESWTDYMQIFEDVTENTINGFASFYSASDVLGQQQQALDEAASESAERRAEAHNRTIEDQMEAAGELTEAERRNFEDRKKDADDFLQEETVSAEQHIQGLEEQAVAMAEWQRNLTTVRSKGGSNELIAHLRDLGPEGVEIAKQLADGTEESIRRMDGALSSMAPNAQVSMEEYRDQLQQQVADQDVWQRNLHKIGKSGMLLPEQVDGLAAKGMDFAPMVANLAAAFEAGGEEAQMAKSMVNKMTRVGALAEDPLVEGFMNATALAAAAAGDGAREAVNAIINELNLLPSQVLAMREEFGLGRLPGEKRRGPQGWGVAAGAAGVSQRRRGDRRSGGGGSSAVGLYQPPPTRGNANGNIISFSSGTERHIAQMAKPGEMRLWAESETGGEAYIPLASAKRKRSTAILSQVASQFGYALMPTGRTTAYGGGGIRGRSTSDMVTGRSPTMGQAAPEIVIVEVPVQSQNITEFSGPIQGLRIEEVEQEANRRKRMSSLAGGV